MTARGIRVYADTSVYGGVGDDEFAEASLAFFETVRMGRHLLVSSPVIRQELAAAPEGIRTFFSEMMPLMELVEVTGDARRLQLDYLEANVVGSRGSTDALHVAVATVSGCRAIVSWNFRHIVHFEKVPLYNGVNLVKGYGTLGIHTPQEVLGYETEEEEV